MSKYYKKVSVSESDYEEAYWGIIKDPDGNIRDRTQEKDKFLANLKSELEFINNLPPSKILDVGCGLGFVLAGIDKKHNKTGLEVSKLAAQFASSYAAIINKPLEKAGINDDSYDVIFSHHVIEHVDSPEDFLNHIKRILKNKGKLILATPDFDSICAKLYKENYRMLYDKTHVNLFSFDSLKSMLLDFGFSIDCFDFPYFNTEYFSDSNIIKMLEYNSGNISPACWGNFMTFYCTNQK